MVAAAAAIADLEPELCAVHLADVLEALPEAEGVVAPDGAFPEGPGYWHYGFTFNAFALEMMRTAFGTDFGLSDLPGFRETASFPSLMTGPSGRGTFGGRRKAVRDRFALQGGTGDFP